MATCQNLHLHLCFQGYRLFPKTPHCLFVIVPKQHVRACLEHPGNTCSKQTMFSANSCFLSSRIFTWCATVWQDEDDTVSHSDNFSQALNVSPLSDSQFVMVEPPMKMIQCHCTCQQYTREYKVNDWKQHRQWNNLQLPNPPKCHFRNFLQGNPSWESWNKLRISLWRPAKIKHIANHKSTNHSDTTTTASFPSLAKLWCGQKEDKVQIYVYFLLEHCILNIKLLYTYFWKTLPTGALIWLTPIWLIWAQIAQPTSNHLKRSHMFLHTPRIREPGSCRFAQSAMELELEFRFIITGVAMAAASTVSFLSVGTQGENWQVQAPLTAVKLSSFMNEFVPKQPRAW